MEIETAIPKLKGDTRASYQALLDYVGMGPMRSLSKLAASYQKSTGLTPTKKLNTLKNWSDQNNWQARIKEYVAFLEKQSARRVQERLLLLQDQDFETGDQLRKVAEEVLQAEAPNFYRTTRKIVPGSPQVVDSTGKVISPGTPDKEIIMVRLNTGDIIRAMRNGSDLQHRAVPHTTEVTPGENGRITITETVIIPDQPPILDDGEPDEADDGSSGTIPG